MTLTPTKPKRGGAGRGQGRKSLNQEPMTKVIRFRATESDHEKFHRLKNGSEVCRVAIREAKEPEQEK